MAPSSFFFAGALCALALIIACVSAQAACDAALLEEFNDTAAYDIMMTASCGSRIGDYGSYDNCRMIPNAHYCVMSLLKEASSEQRCDPNACGLGLCALAAVFVDYPLMINSLSVGLCLPTACNESDVAFIQRYTPAFSPYNAEFLMLTCYDGAPRLARGSLIVIAIIILLAVIVMIASAIDIWRKHAAEALEPPEDEKPLISPSAASSSLRDLRELRSQLPAFAMEGTEHMPFFMRALLCFSLPANLTRLSALTASSSLPAGISLDFLNGLRVLAMWWVITGHTVLNASYVGFTNDYYFAHAVEHSFVFQFWFSAEFAVDIFFVLSGFLVAFLTLRTLSTGQSFGFLSFYASRYLRLTPLLLVTVFLFSQLVPHLTYGPFASYAAPVKGSAHGDCYKYWWPGLLYISNFYPTNYADMCSGPTWYLSADFQMYLLAPFLIVTFYRWRRIGIAALTLLCAGSVICTFVIMHISYPQGVAFSNKIYDKPYTRAAAFFPGLAAAFFVISAKRKDVPPLLRAVFYLLGAGSIGTLIFIPYTQPWSKGGNIVWASLNHFGFGATCAALIVLFAWNYGGYVNSFLSLSFWAPLARLTYGAYLLHPLVLAAWLGAQTQPFTFSYLALEQPVINLTNLTIRQR